MMWIRYAVRTIAALGAVAFFLGGFSQGVEAASAYQTRGRKRIIRRTQKPKLSVDQLKSKTNIDVIKNKSACW